MAMLRATCVDEQCEDDLSAVDSDKDSSSKMYISAFTDDLSTFIARAVSGMDSLHGTGPGVDGPGDTSEHAFP